jgi:hypothetical protein
LFAATAGKKVGACQTPEHIEVHASLVFTRALTALQPRFKRASDRAQDAAEARLKRE